MECSLYSSRGCRAILFAESVVLARRRHRAGSANHTRGRRTCPHYERSQRMKPTLHGLLFTAAALIVTLMLVGLATSPGYTLDQQFGDATVYFHTDRVMLFAPGGCLQAEWRVERIAAVYFNGDPAVGAGVRTLCPGEGAAPTLRVQFMDGTFQEFTAPVRYWLAQIETLAWLGAAATLALASLFTAATRAVGGRAGAGPAQSGPVSRGLSAIGALALIAAIALAVLEIGLRLLLAASGTEAQRIAYLYTRDEIDVRSPSTTIPLPGIDYALSPQRADFNSAGYRGPQIALPKPPGTFRIIVLGASDIYGFTPTDETIPAWLQTTLRERYGYTNVEVINGGIIGYTSWQVYANFALHAAELDLDMAIVYMAGNDVDRRQEAPDCYRGENALRGLDPSARIPSDIGFRELPASALYRLIAIEAGLMPNPADIEARSFQVDVGCARGTGTAEGNIAANPPVYFERNLRYLLAAADVRAVDVVLSTWAYWQGGEEPAAYWRAAVDEHNAIIRAVAADTDTPLIDFAPQAGQDKLLWSDYRHPNSAGSQAQAEFFAAFLDENGLIQ